MTDSATPEISVVIPVCNEEGNVIPLAREIAASLQGTPFEILFVDDGSTDGTAAAVLQARCEGIGEIRLLKHSFRSGQSAAVCSGVRAARAPWIATLDGDGQNNPADIPQLLNALKEGIELVGGNRRHSRRDTWIKRVSSVIANGVRSWMLQDNTPDTGCGLKLFSREAFLDLPYFDHMHRFLPALIKRRGGFIVSVPVSHRPRTHGHSNYGTIDRLLVGIVDLFGVAWLQRRSKLPQINKD